VLGLREALEPGLGLEPVADVTGDGDDPARFVLELDVLEHDLDRYLRPGPVPQGQRHGPRFETARDERLDERPQLGLLEIDGHCRRVELE
jgi:hypothetical protein